jgi:hypothetical protein
MGDPVGSVEAIFSHFGMPFTAAGRQGVETWIAEDARTRTKHGVHRYQAEDFGLDPDRLRDRFAFYMTRFGVKPDVKA